jgi:PAS domain S-box-containing protein
MKIRTKLVINIGMFVIFSLAVSAGILMMTTNVERSIQNNNVIEQMLDGFNDLNIITYGYALYPGERPRMQWESKHASLEKLLRGVTSDQEAALARMAENHKVARTLFDQLIRKGQDSSIPNLKFDFDEETDRIVSQLMAKTQMMRADALVLKHASNASLLSTHRKWFLTVIALILIMLGIVTAMSFFLKRKIIGSLDALYKGTEIIRSGDLDHRTRITTKDEIGRLSGSFDYMTENLKNTMVSRDALQREVEDRIRVEEALRASEERWATTLASIGDAVIATDVDGRITFMNAVAEGLTGWRLDEASTRPVAGVFNVLNEETRKKVENPITRVLLEGKIIGLANHTVLLRKDGTEVPIDDSGAPIRDRNGKTIGAVLVFRDVTGRREAEQALRESEERFRGAAEGSMDAFFLLKAVRSGEQRITDFEFVDVTSQGEKLLAMPRKNVIGQKLCELIPINRTGGFFEKYVRVMETGESLEEEFPISSPEIKATWLHHQVVAIANGVAITSRDITTRKRAEAELRQAAETFEKIFHGNAAAMALARAEDGRLLEVNDRWLDLTGFRRDEVIGKDTVELGLWKNPTDRATIVREVQQHGVVLDKECTCLRRSGQEWIALFHAQIITLRGERVLISSAVDITERKRSLEALQITLQRLHTLVASMHSSILLVDKDGRIAFANQAFCDYFKLRDSLADLEGITSTEMIEKIKNAYLHSDEQVARIREIVRQGERVTGEEVAMRNGRSCIRDFIPIYMDGKSYGRLWQHTDISERKRAEDALKKAHDELEKRVQERTSELSETVQRLRAENILRRQLEETLRESETQVRFFASQCLTAQEAERKRVAGELHDSIAASLAALKFRIDKTAEDMKQGNGGPEWLQDLGSKVMEINTEVRRIMADLRPSILDDLGLIPAMNWFCREYQKTYSHISVEDQIGVEEDEVPDPLKTPIFRISQEAMNNIAKYSKASLVNLSLRKEDDKVLLTVQDNGDGFDPNTVRKGMGLSTMRERAQLSGGSFNLESATGKGTIIRVSWPCY